ncbi:MAG: DNA topoisomerase, partial [Deltaproteobacteria bacterium]
VPTSGRTHFESPDRVITWCVGHLVELVEPATYDPRWKTWRLDALPMVPALFKLRPNPSTPEQYRAVTALLRDPRFHEVVNACDAGREGELIFRYVYDIAGSRLPVRRLWISSLTDDAIREGFRRLRPGAQFDALGDAARCRSEADWLVGMNATRAVTVRFRSRDAGRTVLSIGRVQTPTLAMIVAREHEVTAFVPADYFEVHGAFATPRGERFAARWAQGDRTRLAARVQAETVARRDGAHGEAKDPHGPRVERVETRTVREPPPFLFDLTSLQRTANQRFGFTATRTLEIAQSLYERHKVLTYPRTDSRHLTQDLRNEVPRLLDALATLATYAPFVAPLRPAPPDPGRRVFDDARVHDHHAIIPTATLGAVSRLDRDEQRIFDMVVRRFVGAFHPDAVFDQTDVTVRVGPGTRAPAAQSAPDERDRPLTAVPAGDPDRYRVRGRVRRVAGWQAVAGLDERRTERTQKPRERGGDDDGDPREAVVELPALREGDALDGTFTAVHKQTRPPKRFTEATLLAAMESAGKQIDDDALRLAMKDCGLGTPATRASILETLVKRSYLTRDGKQLRPTPMGIALIDTLPVPTLASPALTGEWEARLARMARGEEPRARFMEDIVRFVREAVSAVRSTAPPTAASMATPAGDKVGRCPRCGADVVELLHRFGCTASGKPCGFAVPKVIAGRAIAAPLARVLLSKRRTQQLGGFRSRAHKPFRAALAIGEDGEVGLVF